MSERLPSVQYPPGKPGVAIQRLKKRKTHLTTKPVSLQHKSLRYGDQLPLKGID